MKLHIGNRNKQMPQPWEPLPCLLACFHVPTPPGRGIHGALLGIRGDDSKRWLLLQNKLWLKSLGYVECIYTHLHICVRMCLRLQTHERNHKKELGILPHRLSGTQRNGFESVYMLCVCVCSVCMCVYASEQIICMYGICEYMSMNRLFVCAWIMCIYVCACEQTVCKCMDYVCTCMFVDRLCVCIHVCEQIMCS